MKIYRITYVLNDVAVCKEIPITHDFKGMYHYEQKDGKLIFAIIKADSEDNALTIANIISKEIKNN